MINNMLATANAEQAARALELARRHYQRARYVRACRMFSKSDSLRPLPPDARDQYEAARRAAARAGRPPAPPAAEETQGFIRFTAWCSTAVRRANRALDAILERWTHRRYRCALKVMFSAILVLGAFRLMVRASPLKAIGALPGNFHWRSKSGNVQFYFPVVSCIVVSLLMNGVGWAFARRAR